MNWLKKITAPKRKFSNKLTIGLALGGGGVRGLAHIGVLSVFQREAIAVKAVAGSSMGAIVGAAYALNPEFNKEKLSKQVAELGISLPSTLSEDKRDKNSFLKRLRQFIDAEKFMVDALWGWGILPESRIAESLRRLTLGKKLEEGRIPIAVVTTDLLSGEKIIFKEGPTDFAVQASSALPGFLPPIQFENRLLADGAFVDMVPAEVVREMGVDFVIAVGVDQEGMRVQVRNGLEAFLRAIELCARHHKRHHLELADLVIRPDFGEAVNPLDFSKTELCIEAGVQAAERTLPELRERLSNPRSLSRTASVKE
ncbi:MAG: patatin-like phospholipase family protein [bacterium]